MTSSHFWNLLAKKLSGEATAEELEALENYLRIHPELAYSTDYLHQAWANGEKHSGTYSAELAFEDHLGRLRAEGISIEESPEIAISRKPWYHRKGMLWAAAVIFLVLSALTWMNFFSPASKPGAVPVISEVNTKPGSKSTKLVLPDSTIVWLNAGSRLTYNENFGQKQRRATLTGEAFFDVRKSGIPFIIHSGHIQIKVLGTAFNVKSYPGEKTETSLLRGQVEITHNNRPGEKWLLKPNEKLIVNNEVKQHPGVKKQALVILAPLEPLNDASLLETSWVENKLVFQDESFAELASRLERWYGVSITIEDEQIARERLSGTFTIETIQEVMEILQLTTHFKYTLKSNHIVITK